MPHNVHPYAHRLVVLRDWKSRWFADGKNFSKFLKGDVLIREFLDKKLRSFHVGGVDIERNQKALKVVIKTARPGMLIGKSGEGAVKLKNEILSFLNKEKLMGQEELKLDIEEVKSPETNSAIVAMMIAESLEKRMPFRRVMKQTIDKVMANKEVKGIKLYLGGRLGGAEIARSEKMKKGRIPLQMFRADIDFARERAHMTYGDIGIKVWIYKGEIFAEKGEKTQKK
jgi:small subunit ribosomal protein S3